MFSPFILFHSSSLFVSLLISSPSRSSHSLYIILPPTLLHTMFLLSSHILTLHHTFPHFLILFYFSPPLPPLSPPIPSPPLKYLLPSSCIFVFFFSPYLNFTVHPLPSLTQRHPLPFNLHIHPFPPTICSILYSFSSSSNLISLSSNFLCNLTSFSFAPSLIVRPLSSLTPPTINTASTAPPNSICTFISSSFYSLLCYVLFKGQTLITLADNLSHHAILFTPAVGCFETPQNTYLKLSPDISIHKPVSPYPLHTLSHPKPVTQLHFYIIFLFAHTQRKLPICHHSDLRVRRIGWMGSREEDLSASLM